MEKCSICDGIRTYSSTSEVKGLIEGISPGGFSGRTMERQMQVIRQLTGYRPASYSVASDRKRTEMTQKTTGSGSISGWISWKDADTKESLPWKAEKKKTRCKALSMNEKGHYVYPQHWLKETLYEMNCSRFCRAEKEKLVKIPKGADAWHQRV